MSDEKVTLKVTHRTKESPGEFRTSIYFKFTGSKTTATRIERAIKKALEG